LGPSKKEVPTKLDEIIEFSELGNFIDLPVRTYSSGMHLRLAFLVSTVIRPGILLEPSGRGFVDDPRVICEQSIPNV